LSGAPRYKGLECVTVAPMPSTLFLSEKLQ
jgi:hypothetical protein